ncbi:glycine cleavage system protein R [Microbacterium deminutum]|uniref:Glycine cleavage system regulatory protein n=1 Tax=Microbacterium deminutum TaxID=344164 RepID=A0ABN2QJZ0_9MICO
MKTLVLTVIGSDRAGLVEAVARIVDEHGGNWENSQLAELAGTFAGVIEVSVPEPRADELQTALSSLDELLTVAVHSAVAPDSAARRQVTFTVLGNDHPGIVREISAALRAQDVSIDHLTTQTRDAAMSGGRLFEATIVARMPASVDVESVRTELERLAAEIQVDIALAE